MTIEWRMIAEFIAKQKSIDVVVRKQNEDVMIDRSMAKSLLGIRR
jgi:hypothetical protein